MASLNYPPSFWWSKSIGNIFLVIVISRFLPTQILNASYATDIHLYTTILGWIELRDNLYQSHLCKSCVNQAMTEAAIFTIGRSRLICYGKIRSLADYRSRSRLLNFKRYIYSLPVLFVGLSSSIKSFNYFLTKPC